MFHIFSTHVPCIFHYIYIYVPYVPYVPYIYIYIIYSPHMFHYESASLVGIREGLFFFCNFGLHLFCMAGSFCMFFVAFFCKLEARLGNKGFICAFCFCIFFAFLFANSKRLLGRYQKPRKTHKNLEQITKTLGNVPKTCRNMFHGLRRAKLAGPAAAPGKTRRPRARQPERCNDAFD